VSTEIPEHGLSKLRNQLKALWASLEDFQTALQREHPTDATPFWRQRYWALDEQVQQLLNLTLQYPALLPVWPEVEVLEMDQWSSSAKNIGELSFADFRSPGGPGKLTGGDVKAAQAIFGGHYHLYQVSSAPYNRPSIGRVWFRENPETKKLVLWKYNYDSSD
jgi:hypothetical protein